MDTDTLVKSEMRLGYLSQVPEIKLVDGHKDVRDFDVIGHNNIKIGEVSDVIVDIFAKHIRYIVVQIEKSIIEGRDVGFWESLTDEMKSWFGSEDDRYTLLPPGLFDVNMYDEIIKAPELKPELFNNAPRIENVSDEIDPVYEKTLVDFYSNNGRNLKNPIIDREQKTKQLYENPIFDRSRFKSSLKSSNTHLSLGLTGPLQRR